MTRQICEGIAAIAQHTTMREGFFVFHADVVDEVFGVVAVGAVDDEVVVGEKGR